MVFHKGAQVLGNCYESMSISTGIVWYCIMNVVGNSNIYWDTVLTGRSSALFFWNCRSKQLQSILKFVRLSLS